MKNFGLCLIIAGIIWGIVAFNMNTSVESVGRTIGSGIFSIDIPSQTVHNFSLADKRRNHLIGAGISLISGVLLFGFGSLRRPTSTDKKCFFCAELIKKEATICRYCGKDQPLKSETIETPEVVQNEVPIETFDEATQEKKTSKIKLCVGVVVIIAIFTSLFWGSDKHAIERNLKKKVKYPSELIVKNIYINDNSACVEFKFKNPSGVSSSSDTILAYKAAGVWETDYKPFRQLFFGFNECKETIESANKRK